MTKQRARANARTRRSEASYKSLHVARTSASFEPFTTIFAQGDRCADVMYIEKGRVRLSAMSPEGSTAVVSELRAGALAGQRRRKSSAEAMTSCIVIMVATTEMRRRLHRDVALSDWLRSRETC